MGYKIPQRCNISLSPLIIFCILSAKSIAQDSSNKALKVINTITEYKESVKIDTNQKMVSLQQLIPNIVLDLRYGTTNNFMKIVMYDEHPRYTFLRQPAAKALAQVQKELIKTGYGLKVFDAYRPYDVTKKFWELVHDERYVANPAQGSGHNRGIAVDLTIINLKTKKELKMPTGFDNFTDSAHHDFMNLPSEVLKNRSLLKETMEKYGFKEFATEWWHYSLPDPEKYEVLDLSFGELKQK
ncbi:MAG TPA: M15 family metallopeptidase [Puia sp.]|nr:M15 family metallopeptidase [Puia sp.]